MGRQETGVRRQEGGGPVHEGARIGRGFYRKKRKGRRRGSRRGADIFYHGWGGKRVKSESSDAGGLRSGMGILPMALGWEGLEKMNQEPTPNAMAD